MLEKNVFLYSVGAIFFFGAFYFIFLYLSQCVMTSQEDNELVQCARARGCVYVFENAHARFPSLYASLLFLTCAKNDKTKSALAMVG